tara:strand:- start:2053 stop:2616 length:564 start_codon:yes stop_codon:yes gene_type:complete
MYIRVDDEVGAMDKLFTNSVLFHDMSTPMQKRMAKVQGDDKELMNKLSKLFPSSHRSSHRSFPPPGIPWNLLLQKCTSTNLETTLVAPIKLHDDYFDLATKEKEAALALCLWPVMQFNDIANHAAMPIFYIGNESAKIAFDFIQDLKEGASIVIQRFWRNRKNKPSFHWVLIAFRRRVFWGPSLCYC